jgi:hypothetical protein
LIARHGRLRRSGEIGVRHAPRAQGIAALPTTDSTPFHIRLQRRSPPTAHPERTRTYVFHSCARTTRAIRPFPKPP